MRSTASASPPRSQITIEWLCASRRLAHARHAAPSAVRLRLHALHASKTTYIPVPPAAACLGGNGHQQTPITRPGTERLPSAAVPTAADRRFMHHLTLCGCRGAPGPQRPGTHCASLRCAAAAARAENAAAPLRTSVCSSCSPQYNVQQSVQVSEGARQLYACTRRRT